MGLGLQEHADQFQSGLCTLAAVMHLGNGVPQKASYVQCVAPKLEYKVADATDKVETKLREPEEGIDRCLGMSGDF